MIAVTDAVLIGGLSAAFVWFGLDWIRQARVERLMREIRDRMDRGE